MSAIPIIIAALQENAGVVALVGPRIHAVAAPLADTLPNAVVLALSEAEEYSLYEGATNYPEATVTVICRGATAGDAIRLGDRVVIALKNGRSIYAGIPATIWRDQVDSTDYTDEGKAFRRLLGFKVRYRNG